MANVDLSEFYRLSRPRRPPCRIGHVLEQLKPAERAQLTAALDTDKGLITASAIGEWLAKRDHEGVSINVISNHRRGVCSCAREAS